MDPQMVTQPVAQAALIDLDATYLFQIAIFLVVYFLMSVFFFKPYVSFLKQRDEATSGLRKRAENALKAAEQAEADAAKRLDSARKAAMTERKVLTDEAVLLRDQMVAVEREHAESRIATEMQALDVEKQAFLGRIDVVAGEVADLIQSQISAVEGGGR